MAIYSRADRQLSRHRHQVHTPAVTPRDPCGWCGRRACAVPRHAVVTGAAGPRGVTSAGTLQRGGQQEEEDNEDFAEDTEDW